MLAKTLDKPEPNFGTVKVTPTTSPPIGITASTEPFIRPTEILQATDLAGTEHSPQRQATNKSLSSISSKQPTSDLHGSSQIVVKSQLTSKSLKVRPTTDHTSDLAGTDSPTVHQVPSRSSSPLAGRQSPVSNYPWTQIQTLTFLTDPLWTYLWRKGNCPTKILMLLLPTRMRPSQRTRIIGNNERDQIVHGMDTHSRYGFSSSHIR